MEYVMAVSATVSRQQPTWSRRTPGGFSSHHLPCSLVAKVCRRAEISIIIRFLTSIIHRRGLPWELSWYRIHLQCRRPWCDSWVTKIWKWQPTAVFLPGQSHGRRSVVGYIQSMGSHRVGQDWATSLPLSFTEGNWSFQKLNDLAKITELGTSLVQNWLPEST